MANMDILETIWRRVSRPVMSVRENQKGGVPRDGVLNLARNVPPSLLRCWGSATFTFTLTLTFSPLLRLPSLAPLFRPFSRIGHKLPIRPGYSTIQLCMPSPMQACLIPCCPIGSITTFSCLGCRRRNQSFIAVELSQNRPRYELSVGQVSTWGS